MRHHRFDGVEFTGQPGSQTVRQPAEGGVALGAVPASDPRPARGLARIGAVACQRASLVGVIRTPLEGCRAPRLGLNVFLAGKPRLIPTTRGTRSRWRWRLRDGGLHMNYRARNRLPADFVLTRYRSRCLDRWRPTPPDA